jgi:hypothetical protein
VGKHRTETRARGAGWALSWAVVGAAAGAVAVIVAGVEWRSVPDLEPVPLPTIEMPQRTLESVTPLDPPGSGVPDAAPTTVQVAEPETTQPTTETPSRAGREPLRFDTPPVYGEIDYRAGRIMEPSVPDGRERERAHARCIAGLEADPGQVAYCEKYYGLESGYVPGGW